MSGRVLMIQGTSSSAGKSLLVAALCRIFARRGVRVAPFKAQNMSNNAAVCADGSEIGRSQALQAAAARVAPTADMNPILLKPEADTRSQVIVNGRPWRTLTAREYFRTKEALWPVVTDALDHLRSEYELVVIEGAGSPAELNLRDVEIVNMAVARYAGATVLLVGDIERGGVFAQLLGTLWLLDDDERSLVRGLLVNKFRGDVSLFDSGRTQLEERGGVPVLGVIPWLSGLDLPEEDAEILNRAASASSAIAAIDIAVIRLPRISNFDDFAPLAAEPQVNLRYVDSAAKLGEPQVIILPGTKSTMADLAWLRESGLAAQILELAERRTHIVGVCGGYQMLGTSLRDPLHVESPQPEAPGLGLLPVVTEFAAQKETHQIRGRITLDRHSPGARDEAVAGYEIHMGQTTGGETWLELTRRSSGASCVLDGAVSPDGRIWGSYVHGLFANDGFRRRWLSSIARVTASTVPVAGAAARYETNLEASLDRLADGVEAALDMSQLTEIIWNSTAPRSKELAHEH